MGGGGGFIGQRPKSTVFLRVLEFRLEFKTEINDLNPNLILNLN